MTFDQYQSSREGGRPVELYQFALGGTLFTYTSAEQPVTISGTVYAAEPMSRGKIIATTQHKQNQLDIRVPSSNVFARNFIGVIPGERASITIFQQQYDDGGTPELVTVFKGLVSTVSFSKNAKEANITCRPITSAANRPMPRQTYQRVCNHMLFDARCGVNEVSFQETGQVIAVSDRTVTLANTFTNLTGDYWEAGYIKFGSEYRLIMSQSSDVMTLNLPFANSPLSETVTAAPGCKHRLQADCIDKFSNGDNYGGFPYVPTKNPFDIGLD